MTITDGGPVDPTSADVVGRRTGLWPSVALTALGLAVIAAYSSFGRPLWIDEFVHFALSGLPPQEAMTALYRSLGPNLSHGQTGVYMLYDYWALWWGGASLFLLRLPSLLSGAFLLIAAVTIIRIKGFSAWWQALVILSLAGQATLMFNVGNARPYMMLTATSLAMFAYYLYPLNERRSLMARGMAIFGILIGSVSHPYFAVFLPLAIIFGIWDQQLNGQFTLNRASLTAFVNLRFAVPGIILFFGVGSATWMRGTPDFAFDPWEWMGPWGAARSFLMTHGDFLLPPGDLPPRSLALGMVGLLAAVVFIVVRGWDRRLVPALGLIVIGLATSLLFSAISMLTSYWILDRQWVVGAALAAVGLVWLLAQSYGVCRARSRPWALVIIAVVSALITINGVLAATSAMRAIPDWLVAWADVRATVPAGAARDVPAGFDNDDWVKLANQNVSVGGPVWPSVGEYYRAYVEDR